MEYDFWSDDPSPEQAAPSSYYTNAEFGYAQEPPPNNIGGYGIAQPQQQGGGYAVNPAAYAPLQNDTSVADKYRLKNSTIGGMDFNTFDRMSGYTVPGGGAMGQSTQGAPGYRMGGGSTASAVQNQGPGGAGNFLNSTQPYGDINKYLTMAGFKQGGAGTPPTDLYSLYAQFLKDPTSMTANPMYKAMMDASTQATDRKMSAGGYNGSGNILAELQKTGMGVAGAYLPQMADMYRGGANTEMANWLGQVQGNTAEGNLGVNMYNSQATDQFRRALQNIMDQNQGYSQAGAASAYQQMNPTYARLLQLMNGA